MVNWRYILCDLEGVEVGELFQVRDPNRSRILNGMASATGTIGLENPMADVVVGSTAGERIRNLLKVYRNGERFLVGPLTDAEEVLGPDGVGSVSFSAASPLWRLLYRLVGKTVAGYADGTPLAPKDLSQIAQGVIEVLNAEKDTGIRIGVIGASSDSYVERAWFKKAGELIAELAAGARLGGYDFDLEPVEPFADAMGVQIATFNTYGSKGQVRPEVVFEYGDGKRNIQTARRPISGSTRATRTYSLAPGWPDAIAEGDTAVVTGDGADAELEGERFEEVVGSGDLGVLDLRQRLVDAHVAVRKHPREQWIFTPVANLEYQYGVDYEEGDIVTARVVNPHTGAVRLNGLVRLYAAAFAGDELGNETPELTVTRE